MHRLFFFSSTRPVNWSWCVGDWFLTPSSSCSLAWQRATGLLRELALISRTVSMVSSQRAASARLCKKHFNEATDRWSSKEQGSIAGKWAPEPSAPFIQHSPSQLTDRAAGRGKKDISQMFIQEYVSHWPLFYSDVKQLLTPVLKPVLQWCNVCCINNPWDKHFITNRLYYLSIRELKKLWDLLWEKTVVHWRVGVCVWGWRGRGGGGGSLAL